MTVTELPIELDLEIAAFCRERGIKLPYLDVLHGDFDPRRSDVDVLIRTCRVRASAPG